MPETKSRKRTRFLQKSTSCERGHNRKLDIPLSTEELPDAATQRAIIEGLKPDKNDIEAYYYEYAVCKQWCKQWKKYLGFIEGKSPGQTRPPGPLIMNIHDDTANTYIKGPVWRKLLEWYGLDPQHELDRQYRGDKNEKEAGRKCSVSMSVSMLSPVVNLVKHRVKGFCLDEYVGYIECQIRCIFNIPKHKSSRLWICESGKEFELLTDRTEELQWAYGLEEGKEYTLALEVQQDNGSWPSGRIMQSEGDLDCFTSVTSGREWSHDWKAKQQEEMSQVTDNCVNQLSGYIKQCMTGLLQREDTRIAELHSLKTTLLKHQAQNTQFEQALELRSRDLQNYKEQVKLDAKQLKTDKYFFNVQKDRFEEEMKYMQELNKVTDTIVKLNVGGHEFMTSTMTLTRDPDSMLAAMFSGRHHLRLTLDGAVFIDRDGTHFRWILNFLRDGALHPGTLPRDESLILELMAEAEYYQLQGLHTFLQGLLDNRWEEEETEAVFQEEFLAISGVFNLFQSDDEDW